MGSFTSIILTGSEHDYHGGILPTHYLFLSENSRPAWILVEQNYNISRNKHEKIRWIPTVDNMLMDALLMVAIYVDKNKKMKELFRKLFNNPDSDYIQLYEDIKKEDLELLYEGCRNVEFKSKLVISVLQGSTITGQLDKLKSCKINYELCVSDKTNNNSH